MGFNSGFKGLNSFSSLNEWNIVAISSTLILFFFRRLELEFKLFQQFTFALKAPINV